MLCDKDNVPLKVGDTVLTSDGCLYIIMDVIYYELAVDVICMDKLTRNFKSFQPRELMKIEVKG